jgi:hypothetical protein
MKPKMKTIKNLQSLVGLELSVDNQTGEAGRDFEFLIQAKLGITVDKGPGPDLKKFNLEIKTREETAHGDETVGNMTIAQIIITPFEQTNLWRKVQHQIRVKTRKEDYHSVDEHGYITTKQKNIITKIGLFDFTDEHIQRDLKNSYEQARDALTKLHTKSLADKTELIFGDYHKIKGTRYGYLEYKSSNSFSFRVPFRRMDELESRSKKCSDFLTSTDE